MLIELLATTIIATTQVNEDEAEFNCWTMGNHDCGDSPRFLTDDGFLAAVLAPLEDGRVFASVLDGRVLELERVDSHLADALAEGSAPDATTRTWAACSVYVGETSWAFCPDGWVESW